MYFKGLLRRFRRGIYPDGVSPHPARRLPALEPVRHLQVLDRYVGCWVAVKDGQVVDAAKTSRELASKIHYRNLRGVVVEYVAPPSSVEKVGLG